MYILVRHPIKTDVWELISLPQKDKESTVHAEFYDYPLAVGVLNFLNNGK